MKNENEIYNYYLRNEMSVLKRICYPMIKKIGGISESDYDDFYSIANETLYQAAQSYDEDKNDNFDLFLRGCISRKFKTELTKRNRIRRIDASKIDSLDRKISTDSDTTLGDTLANKGLLEDDIEELKSTDRVEKYISSLSKKQKTIANMIMNGYDAELIKERLNMTDQRYKDCIKRMGTIDKRILLR